jgi:hypothetical protein
MVWLDGKRNSYLTLVAAGRRPFKYMLPRESIKCMHANWLWCLICVSFLRLWHEAKTIKRVEHMIVIKPYTFANCRTSLNFGWTLGTPSLTFRNQYFFHDESLCCYFKTEFSFRQKNWKILLLVKRRYIVVWCFMLCFSSLQLTIYLPLFKLDGTTIMHQS